MFLLPLTSVLIYIYFACELHYLYFHVVLRIISYVILTAINGTINQRLVRILGSVFNSALRSQLIFTKLPYVELIFTILPYVQLW